MSLSDMEMITILLFLPPKELNLFPEKLQKYKKFFFRYRNLLHEIKEIISERCVHLLWFLRDHQKVFKNTIRDMFFNDKIYDYRMLRVLGTSEFENVISTSDCQTALETLLLRKLEISSSQETILQWCLDRLGTQLDIRYIPEPELAFLVFIMAEDGRHDHLVTIKHVVNDTDKFVRMLRIEKCAALRYACLNGHVGCVRFMMQYLTVDDARSMDNDALKSAYSNGHWKIVQILLEHGLEYKDLLGEIKVPTERSA